ncbi:MAG: hypothetical protein MRY21_02625 [Simkaniaceae bacterium]|nr:hypothetical protein [Simkaniaceae bacterium]
MGFHFEMEVPRRRELRMFEITFLLHADTEIFYPEKLMEFKKALVERCCQPIWYQIACKAALQLTFYSM